MNLDQGMAVISDKNLASLSQSIGSEWPLLGISLLFSQAQIDQLLEAHPRNMSKCVLMMLTKWRDAVTTYDGINPWNVLKKALEDIGRFDLAKELEEASCSTGDVLDERILNSLEEQIGAISFGSQLTDINRISGQTKQCLERWFKDRHLFVETSAWREAWKLIWENKIVILFGNPGDGKTTLAYHLLKKFELNGFIPAIVSSPELIEQCYNVDDKVVFLVDDAFGSPGLNRQLVENWIRLSNKIVSFLESDNFRVILTTRRQVYLSCELEIEDCDCFSGSVFDMTEKGNALTDEEKQEILKKYCENRNIDVTDEKINTACHSISSGFPLLCKLYTASSALQQIEDFFEKPLSVLVHQLHILAKIEPKAFCGLVMLLINDGRLSNAVFDVFQQNDQTKSQISVVKEACQLDGSVSLASIEAGLMSLVGVYVLEQDEYYIFIHDAIFDAVTFVFGEKYLNKVLQICSAKFLQRRVRCYKKVTQQSDVTDLLYLPKKLTKQLASRFVSDITKGYLSEVFEHPSFHDEQVTQFFLNDFQNLSDGTIRRIVHRRDNISRKRLMEFVCRHDMVEILRILLDKGVPVTDDMWLFACKHNETAVVDLLIERGMNVNKLSDVYGIGGIHVAAEEGQLEMLKHLIRRGANASLKTTENAEPLNLACRTWKEDCMKFLLELGVNPNIVRTYGQTPIHIAASKGSLEWTKYLVSKGANAFINNRADQQPIHLASTSDNPDLITYLVQLGADSNALTKDMKTPLNFACIAGQTKNVETLLKCGASVDSKDTRGRLPLHDACMSRSDCVNILSLLVHAHSIKNNSCLTNVNTPRTLAVSNVHHENRKTHHELVAESNTTKAKFHSDDTRVFENTSESTSHAALNDLDDVDGACAIDVIGNSCSAMADVQIEPGNYVDVKDMNNMTPLHYACKQLNDLGIERVKMLVEMGADIHAIDSTRMQPLTYACDNGSIKIAEFLIGKGADVNWQGFNKQCAIHYASAVNKVELLELLVRHGANKNSSNNSGMKPVHFACRQNAVSNLECLLKLGVDPDQEDDAKYTPLFYACLHGHVDIVRILLDSGASINHVDLQGRKPIDMLQLRACDAEIKELFAEHADRPL